MKTSSLQVEEKLSQLYNQCDIKTLKEIVVSKVDQNKDERIGKECEDWGKRYHHIHNFPLH